MKIILLIVGLLLATVGGVMTYRALYRDPKAGVVITNSEVREVPNYGKVVGGALLLVGGTALAFYSATRMKK